MRQRCVRLIIAALVVAALAAAVLAGCSPAAKPSGPVRVVIAQGADPTTLDPHNHRETTTQNVCLHIYDTLVTRDKDMKIIPKLAESWTFIDDTTVRFKLKPNIKFSNGEPLTAETVKYNVERVTEQLPGAEPTKSDFVYVNWAGASVVDELTVDISMKNPDTLFLSLLANFYIVPKKYTEDNGFEALDKKPIGTGPYTLKEWVHEDKVVLTVRSDYWQEKAKIGEVVFRPLPEAATRIAELQTGGIDVMVNLPPHNIKDLEAHSHAEARTAPSARVVYGFFNCLDYDLWKDPRVRQALNYAVDVPALIEHVYEGRGTRVSTMAPPYFVGYDPSHPMYEYNPEKAKQLLAEAGFRTGTEIEILTTRGRFLNDAQLAEALAGYLEAVGVRVKLNAVEFGVFAKQTQERTIPEMMVAALGNPHFSTHYSMTYIVRTGTQSFSWYSNPEVDRLYDEAGSISDPVRVEQLLQQALRLLFDDPPFIYLFALEDVYGVNNRIDWQPRTDELIDMYGVTAK